jgi:hypothetical protein
MDRKAEQLKDGVPVDFFSVFMGTQKQGDFNEFDEALKEAERLTRLHPDRFVSVYDRFDDRHHQVKVVGREWRVRMI